MLASHMQQYHIGCWHGIPKKHPREAHTSVPTLLLEAHTTHDGTAAANEKDGAKYDRKRRARRAEAPRQICAAFVLLRHSEVCARPAPSTSNLHPRQWQNGSVEVRAVLQLQQVDVRSETGEGAMQGQYGWQARLHVHEEELDRC